MLPLQSISTRIAGFCTTICFYFEKKKVVLLYDLNIPLYFYFTRRILPQVYLNKWHSTNSHENFSLWYISLRFQKILKNIFCLKSEFHFYVGSMSFHYCYPSDIGIGKKESLCLRKWLVSPVCVSIFWVKDHSNGYWLKTTIIFFLHTYNFQVEVGWSSWSWLGNCVSSWVQLGLDSCLCLGVSMSVNSETSSGKAAATGGHISQGEIQVGKQEHGLSLELAHCYFHPYIID